MRLKSADTYACSLPLECLLLSQGEIRGGGPARGRSPLEDLAPPALGETDMRLLAHSQSQGLWKNTVKHNDNEIALCHLKGLVKETEKTRAIISPGQFRTQLCQV